MTMTQAPTMLIPSDTRTPDHSRALSLARFPMSMRASTDPVAPLVRAAILAGCRGGGAFLLGTALGASVVTAAVVSSRPPPPPQVVYAPPPRPGHDWQPGYWVLRDDRWEWVDGHWVANHPGYAWQPAHWVEDPDQRWRLIPGGWVLAR